MSMAIETSDLRDLLRDGDELYWTDEELDAAILAAGGENINRAAGQAVQALAIQYALTGRSIRTDDLTLDAKDRGSDLLAVAKSFFDSAASDDSAAASDFFQIVPFGGRASSCCTRPEASPYPCCGTC